MAGDLQLVRVKAELAEHRRVDVGDVVPVLDRMEAELVGLAVSDAALNAAAGQPDRETVGMMVAAGAVLCSRRSAELRRPDNDGLVQ